MLTGIELAVALLMGHAVADFWMQSDALARMKNRNRAAEAPPGQTLQLVWPFALSAHALHHGLCVWVVSGSVELGVSETLAHWLIDFGKCENWYGIYLDQALHGVCKFVWWVWIMA